VFLRLTHDLFALIVDHEDNISTDTERRAVLSAIAETFLFAKTHVDRRKCGVVNLVRPTTIAMQFITLSAHLCLLHVGVTAETCSTIPTHGRQTNRRMSNITIQQYRAVHSCTMLTLKMVGMYLLSC